MISSSEEFVCIDCKDTGRRTWVQADGIELSDLCHCAAGHFIRKVMNGQI